VIHKSSGLPSKDFHPRRQGVVVPMPAIIILNTLNRTEEMAMQLQRLQKTIKARTWQ
jgi:hypothetical protein